MRIDGQAVPAETPTNRIDRLDRFQRRHRWAAFPIAVAYKAFDDRMPYLAALVAYYAFVSLFPLLLLFVTIVGFLVESHPGLRHEVVAGALHHFPVLGPRLRTSINGFHGSGGALAVGIIGTLYGGLGATQAAQAALNQIYGVPRNRQPNPVRSRLRSLLLVLVFGTGILVSTGVAAIVSTLAGALSWAGPAVRAVGFVLAFGVNVALFTAVLQLLTARRLRTRNVITGGIIAGGMFEVLQWVGSIYVAHETKHGTSLYGVFGVVLAALAWIYVQSFVLMLAAEVNVVLHHRLWPRSLMTPFTDDVRLTDADRRAYTSYARAQRHKGFQVISSRYQPHGDPGARVSDR